MLKIKGDENGKRHAKDQEFNLKIDPGKNCWYHSEINF